MLLKLRFSNFRSFKDLQELSFEASALKGLNESIVPSDATQYGVLKSLAVYGPNASGKTNLLRALSFMRDAVRHSQKDWDPDGPINTHSFVIQSEELQPSRFEVDFLLEGVRYQYGFTLTTQEVLEEWLHAFPSKKRQVWFHRTSGFQFGRYLQGENQTIANLTRRNSLFLSAAAQNNHEMLLPIYRWFNSIHLVTSYRKELSGSTAELCQDPKFREEVIRFMAAADLGVVGIDSHEEEVGEKVKQLYSKMKSVFPDANLSEKMTVISFLHKAGESRPPFLLPLTSESDGTVAYFALLGPVLKSLFEGGILCIDELDASLHPLMAMEIVKTFNSQARNPKSAQLLFNTHDTNLLSTKLLRRDQIWFTEKDKEGKSHLYPLTEHAPRETDNLQAGYLEGRYGALPFIGSTEMLDPATDTDGTDTNRR